MDIDPKLRKLKQNLRALLQSAGRHGLTEEEMERDYEDLFNMKFPYVEFGASSTDELLRNVPDVVMVFPAHGTQPKLYYAVSDPKTRHLESLIERQKVCPPTRFGGIVPGVVNKEDRYEATSTTAVPMAESRPKPAEHKGYRIGPAYADVARMNPQPNMGNNNTVLRQKLAQRLREATSKRNFSSTDYFGQGEPQCQLAPVIPKPEMRSLAGGNDAGNANAMMLNSQFSSVASGNSPPQPMQTQHSMAGGNGISKPNSGCFPISTGNGAPMGKGETRSIMAKSGGPMRNPEIYPVASGSGNGMAIGGRQQNSDNRKSRDEANEILRKLQEARLRSTVSSSNPVRQQPATVASSIFNSGRFPPPQLQQHMTVPSFRPVLPNVMQPDIGYVRPARPGFTILRPSLPDHGEPCKPPPSPPAEAAAARSSVVPQRQRHDSESSNAFSSVTTVLPEFPEEAPIIVPAHLPYGAKIPRQLWEVTYTILREHGNGHEWMDVRQFQTEYARRTKKPLSSEYLIKCGIRSFKQLFVVLPHVDVMHSPDEVMYIRLLSPSLKHQKKNGALFDVKPRFKSTRPHSHGGTAVTEELLNEMDEENVKIPCPPSSTMAFGNRGKNDPVERIPQDLRCQVYHLLWNHFRNGIDISTFSERFGKRYGNPINTMRDCGMPLTRVLYHMGDLVDVGTAEDGKVWLRPVDYKIVKGLMEEQKKNKSKFTVEEKKDEWDDGFFDQ